MDGSHFPPDDPDTVVDNYIEHIIHDGTPAETRELIDILDRFSGCECGCRGRNHMQEVYQALYELIQQRHQTNITITKTHR